MKKVYARHEVPAASGLCLSVVDDAIACGDLDSYTVGRKRYVPAAALDRWLKFLEHESKAGRPVAYRARDPERRRSEQLSAKGRAHA